MVNYFWIFFLFRQCFETRPANHRDNPVNTSLFKVAIKALGACVVIGNFEYVSLFSSVFFLLTLNWQGYISWLSCSDSSIVVVITSRKLQNSFTSVSNYQMYEKNMTKDVKKRSGEQCLGSVFFFQKKMSKMRFYFIAYIFIMLLFQKIKTLSQNSFIAIDSFYPTNQH